MSTAVQFAGGAKVERRGYCKVCRRALKNPKYVELGIGPICAAKGGGGGGGFRQEHGADWHIVKSDSERRIVWIVDEDRGNRSVTNDADKVVAELHVNYPGFRIIYRDSIGNWDELCHDGALFTGYRPARDMGVAA